MSDKEQRPDPKIGDVNLIDVSTPADLATSLPSALAGQAEDENKLVGTVIMDRFLVESIAGHGGMSVVYKAKHLLLKKTIALKTLHKQLANQARYIQRFKVEAQAASSLSHENIVAVFDFGVLQNECAFLAMEYVEGEQLAEVIARERHMDLARAIDLTVQCCNALEHAHGKGIVHRDLKPSNVILTQTEKGETVKIVDFGIAKVWSDDQNLTRTGETLGSPPYMSPEQCRGDEQLDARSDIYSLGCLFYEMLCGKAPLLGSTVYDTIHKQMMEMPRSISHTRDDIKAVAEVDAVLLNSLAKNPNARYQSMSEFRDALLELKEQVCGAHSMSTTLAASWKVFNKRHLAGRQNDYKPLKALLATGICLAALGTAAVHFLTPRPATAPPIAQVSFDSGATAGESYENAYHKQMQIAQSKRDRGEDASKSLQTAATNGLMAFGEQDGRYLKALQMLQAEYVRNKRTADAQKVADELGRIKKFRIELGEPLSNGSKIQDLIMEMQLHPGDQKTIKALITTLTNQAEIFGNTGRHADSVKEAKRAIDLSDKYFPNSNLSLRAHLIRAQQLRNIGEKTEASVEFGNVAKIAGSDQTDEKMKGYAHFGIAEDAYWSSVPPNKDTRFDEAIKNYRLAIQHFKSFYKGPSPQEADSLEGLGRALACVQKFNEAEDSVLKSVEMSKTVEGPNNRTLGKRLGNLGFVYRKANNEAMAERSYKRALDSVHGHSWGDNVWAARMSAQLGRIYYFQGKNRLAEAHLKQALSLLSRNNTHHTLAWENQPGEFWESGALLRELYIKENRPQEINKLNELIRAAHREGKQGKGETGTTTASEDRPATEDKPTSQPERGSLRELR